MKILKKRALALLVDSFIFAFIVAACQMAIPNLLLDKGLLLILLFIPFFFRDFVFRNASIGKKILGILIYDNSWKPPSFKTLLKRSFFTATVGYALCWKAKFVDGNCLSVIDWERERLGTRVIDKKVFNKLSFEAKNMSGDFAANMSKLYNTYLQNLYSE